MKNLLFSIRLVTLIFFGGCAHSEFASTPDAPALPHDQCLVCKYNADLACIDVEVEPDTPSYLYEGKTYHFCSEACRDKFRKNPAKYAGR